MNLVNMLILDNNNDINKITKKENVILGIKISKTYDELVLSQSHYIKTIGKKINKYEDIIKTPIDLYLYYLKYWLNNISITIFTYK